jgi:hypothetical protein
VLRHGGESGAAALSAIDHDGRSNTALSTAIAALLAPGPSEAEPDTTVAVSAPPPAPLPESLTQEAINATFAEHPDDLRTCIIDELGRNPELAQVRIAFIAESDGSAHAFSFAPNRPEFVDCLYAKVASYRFPRFRAGREVGRYVIAVRTREPPAPTGDDGAEKPWWQWYARSPRANGSTKLPDPWWRSRQPLAPLSVTAKTDAPAATTTTPSSDGAGTSHSAARPPEPQPPAAGAPAANVPTSTPPTSPQPAPPEDDAWWVPTAR